jgi:hypothetical protein
VKRIIKAQGEITFKTWAYQPGFSNFNYVRYLCRGLITISSDYHVEKHIMARHRVLEGSDPTGADWQGGREKKGWVEQTRAQDRERKGEGLRERANGRGRKLRRCVARDRTRMGTKVGRR